MATLAKRLDGLPLALVIAGSYMRQTGIGPSKYLELYYQSWGNLQKGAQPHRYYSNGNLVGTWMISYLEIEKNTPSAAKLLLLLACYDNQDIWYDLIYQGLQEDNKPGWLYEAVFNEINFSLAIQALMDFSLIQAKPTLSSYSLHPVVQDWCQSYMQEKNDKDKMIGIAMISTGFSVTSPDKPQYWISQRRLLPHADRMFKAIQNRESLEQLTMVDSVHYLGNLYKDQGKLQEAEAMYQQALTGYEKALGPDHTSTLDSVHNLGILYKDQGKLQKAEAMYQRALTGKEKALGPDHTSTLDSVHCLGILYRNQGKLQEAEVMYQRALTGTEKALGSDHTSTLDSVHNLGNLYRDQGKLQEAEAMYQRALTGRKKALGPDHTSTLRSVHCLGILYSDQGKMQEAEAMYQRALTGYEKALGPDHHLTLQVTDALRLVSNKGLSYILYS
jgi:tetratricopeptide (TPR) repeat protein